MIAGLFSSGIEFVAFSNTLFSFQNGVKRVFEDFTSEQISFLERELSADEKAQKTLTSKNHSENLRQFGICRFGACNETVDFTDKGKKSDTEYYNCGLRGTCPHEGKRCHEISASGGVLSFRQVEIMKLVTDGLINKEIAIQLNLSENTVATHIQNIILKIGGRNRVDIATFIKDRGIR